MRLYDEWMALLKEGKGKLLPSEAIDRLAARYHMDRELVATIVFKTFRE